VNSHAVHRGTAVIEMKTMTIASLPHLGRDHAGQILAKERLTILGAIGQGQYGPSERLWVDVNLTTLRGHGVAHWTAGKT
jgi:hypothetical protein